MKKMKNMLEITMKAIKASRKYRANAQTEEVEVSYSASESSSGANITIYYMQVGKMQHGRIRHEHYHVNRTIALRSVFAIMDVFNDHGLKWEVEEFQEYSFGFHIKVGKDIKDNVIHTEKD